ncbi:MAG: hypothetical protein U0872_14100 [Planctomycetaceae bacterium]
MTEFGPIPTVLEPVAAVTWTVLSLPSNIDPTYDSLMSQQIL